ncbi:relaxase/mobilization nuclease domain-containing protein [Lacticaseibacillus jixiensis]|uniref:relaxase/mobilization nuclease domain-containing protein n=1 Tax=Lacticaseibacillus jixiensis TaxID=3231926 RepID=UPI0036F43D42
MAVWALPQNTDSLARVVRYVKRKKLKNDTVDWLIEHHADPEVIESAKGSRAIFIEGINCDPAYALQEMNDLNKMYGQVKAKNQGLITILSFDLGESSALRAADIRKSLLYAKHLLAMAFPDNQTLLVAQVDGKTHHVHVHGVTNKTLMSTGKKIHFERGGVLEKLKELNDSECQVGDYNYNFDYKHSVYSDDRVTGREERAKANGQWNTRLYVKSRIDDAMMADDITSMEDLQEFLGKVDEDGYTITMKTGKDKHVTYVVTDTTTGKDRISKRGQRIIDPKTGKPKRSYTTFRAKETALGVDFWAETMNTYLKKKERNYELQAKNRLRQQDLAERIIERAVADSAPQQNTIDSDRDPSDDPVAQEPGHDETDYSASDGSIELRGDDGEDPVNDSEDGEPLTIAAAIEASDEQERADRDRQQTQTRRHQDPDTTLTDTARGSDQGAGRAERRSEPGYRSAGNDPDWRSDDHQLTQTSTGSVRTAGRGDQADDDVWPAVEPDRGRRKVGLGADVFSSGHARKAHWPAPEHRSAFSKLIAPAKQVTAKLKTALHSFEEGLARARERAAQVAQQAMQLIKHKQQRDEKMRYRDTEVPDSERDAVDEEIAYYTRQDSWQVLSDKRKSLRERYDVIRDAHGQPPVTDEEYQQVYAKHVAWSRTKRPFKLTTKPDELGPVPTGEYAKITVQYRVTHGACPDVSDEQIAKEENTKRRAARFAAQKAFQEALVGPDAMAGGGSTGGQPARVPGAKDSPAKAAASPEKSGVEPAPEHSAVKTPEQRAPSEIPGE